MIETLRPSYQASLLNRPIFLIGMCRSGTTVMAEILSRHPEMFWLSNYQNRFPAFPAVSLVNRLNNNEFVGVTLGKTRNKAKGWKKFSKYLPAQSEAHYIWAQYCGLDFPDSYMLGRRAGNDERAAFLRFLSGVGRMHGKNRFFHKFTGPARIGYLHSIFPDAIFINLVRDPRAVIASLFKSGFWSRGGGKEKLWWDGSGILEDELDVYKGTDLLPVALGAIQWDRIHTHMAEEAAEVLEPHQMLNIRYEDFSRNPRRVLLSVIDTCGLPRSGRVEEFLDSLNIRAGMNDKFKSQFSADELAAISRLTAQTAARFGYDL